MNIVNKKELTTPYQFILRVASALQNHLQIIPLPRKLYGVQEKLYLSNCLECRTCKTKYCLKHRYPNTHSCTGNPAGNPAGKSTGMNAFLQSLHITFKKKKKK
eukprot:GHVH01000666.1.p1 GENE.GHVH01000666.1~~GHVH01000666.1.p1  ORF type:complete len:103 (-),score=11.70 GHVH01000666.1:38-346(-)